MTEVADPSAAASPRPRPARTGPQDLTYRLDAALVERLASAEPDWLADERRRALLAYEALPVEPNRLYTPYVDLRAAVLGDVVASDAPTASAASPSAGAPPTGSPPWPRSRRTGRPRSSSPTPRAGPASPWTRSTASSVATPRPPAA